MVDPIPKDTGIRTVSRLIFQLRRFNCFFSSTPRPKKVTNIPSFRPEQKTNDFKKKCGKRFVSIRLFFCLVEKSSVARYYPHKLKFVAVFQVFLLYHDLNLDGGLFALTPFLSNSILFEYCHMNRDWTNCCA